MIQDYKFDARLRDRRRKKGRTLALYAAASVVTGTVVAFALPSTQTDSKQQIALDALPAPTEVLTTKELSVISSPLALPNTPSTTTTAELPPGDEDEPELNPAAPSLLANALHQPYPPVKITTEAKTALEAVELTSPSQAEAPVSDPAILTDLTVPSQPDPVDTAPPQATLKKYRIAKGDTLAGIFKSHGLSPATLHKIVSTGGEAKKLSHIRPGQELEFEIDPDGQLARLTFFKNRIESLQVSRKDDGFAVTLNNKAIDNRPSSVIGTIQSSLFVDGQKAGLTDGQIMELAEIFGWDIDFALEIRAGDQFRVLFEEQYVDGKKFGNGPILAAEFVNRGKTYQAFRYENDNQASYYDADGRSKRRAFIRTPIKFARISSRFQPKRWHPVLKKWKAHKGVDYAAPTGTPIKATGKGKVVFRGWQKGYGRVVIVQHSGKYKTVYAHMSKFRGSVKKGSRVNQGQVIGYVGASGWATGPHLHYEFRVNDVKRNPLTVQLPKSLPLPKAQLAAYKRSIAPLTQKLASIRQATMVAQAGN